MANLSHVTALIPAAGLGTRLRPHTFSQPKVLIPVAGKPVIGYILDFLKEAGIRKVVIVVGHLGEQVKTYVSAAYDFEVVFVRQEEFLGLGYAIHLCRQAVSGPVLIVLGDTLVEGAFVEAIARGESWIGVKEVEDPSRFGVVQDDGRGRILKLIEKPQNAVSRKAIGGIYYLRESRCLFDALASLITRDVRTRGEFQLTDALQAMVEAGEVIRAVEIVEWHDCGKVESLLETNRYLLKKRAGPPPSVPGCVIIPPVHIGRDAVVSHCVIGPYVSIGDRVELDNLIISDSIVNDEAVITNAILARSVIGHGAVLVGTQQKLNIGDNSEFMAGEV